MDVKGPRWICTECGHASPERFFEDICPKCGMSYWMCDGCGYTAVAPMSPDPCPECGMHCHFTNITCYIPELGTPMDIDIELKEKRTCQLPTIKHIAE